MSTEKEATNAIKLHSRNTGERNREVLREALVNNDEIRSMREALKKRTGFDMMSEVDFIKPLLSNRFDWKKVRGKMEEAETASSFNQVLRAGVQTVVNNMYQSVPTSFDDWAHVIQSNKDTELYAPLHGISFPREVGRQEKYSQARAAGLDIKLKNRKYGEIYPIEKELLNDDQTGQFQQQAGLIGEYLKLVLEVLAYAKLASSTSTMQYGDMTVPATETQPASETNYPYATAAASFQGGGFNRPASFGLLNQANLQTAFQAQMNQKNLLGLRLLVQPNRIICGPRYRFDVAVLLNSSYYPTGATAGSTGGAFSINPLQSIAQATVSRFIFRRDTGALDDGTSTPWWLVDDTKPWFIIQVREGALVSQENPESGESFDRDIVRFKGSTRCNADFIEPRFAWLGNDGSVTA